MSRREIEVISNDAGRTPKLVMVAICIIAAFASTVFVLAAIAGRDLPAETLPLLFKPDMVIWGSAMGVVAAGATLLSWRILRLDVRPTALRGLLTPYLVLAILFVANVMISVSFLEIRLGLDPVDFGPGLIATLFRSTYSLALLLSPILAPAGWFIGRWAQRRHRAATATAQVTESFT